MNDVSKKVALIYGGTGYIGSSITLSLRSLGFVVITAGRNPSDNKDHVVSDISDNASVQTVINRIITDYGRLDIVVHSSSPAIERVPLLKGQPKSFNEHVAVAVYGTYNLAVSALPHISPNGAFIVITSGIIKDLSKPLKRGAYAFAKQAQHNLTAQIALEHGNVRVFEIMPDFLPGGLNKDLPIAIQREFAKRSNCTMASADDVAHIINMIYDGQTPYNRNCIIDVASQAVIPFAV